MCLFIVWPVSLDQSTGEKIIESVFNRFFGCLRGFAFGIYRLQPLFKLGKESIQLRSVFIYQVIDIGVLRVKMAKIPDLFLEGQQRIYFIGNPTRIYLGIFKKEQ